MLCCHLLFKAWDGVLSGDRLQGTFGAVFYFSSATGSTQHLPWWQVHCSDVIYSDCWASSLIAQPPSLFQGAFSRLAHLMISCFTFMSVMVSIVRSTPWSRAHLCVASLPGCPWEHVSWAHWAGSSSSFHPSPHPPGLLHFWQPALSLFRCSLVVQLLDMWCACA